MAFSNERSFEIFELWDLEGPELAQGTRSEFTAFINFFINQNCLYFRIIRIERSIKKKK